MPGKADVIVAVLSALIPSIGARNSKGGRRVVRNSSGRIKGEGKARTIIDEVFRPSGVIAKKPSKLLSNSTSSAELNANGTKKSIVASAASKKLGSNAKTKAASKKLGSSVKTKNVAFGL